MHQETFALNCSRTSLAMDGTLVVVVEMSLSTWLVCAEVPGLERRVIHSTSIPVKRDHRRAKTDRLDRQLMMRAFPGPVRTKGFKSARSP